MRDPICVVIGWASSLDWGTIPAWITATVAFWATKTWIRQLRFQRGDELIGAALNLKGAMFKSLAYIDYGEKNSLFGERISEAYAAGREFNSRLIVAKRYYKDLSNIDGDEFIRYIDKARDNGKAVYKNKDASQVSEDSYDAGNKEIKDAFGALVEKLVKIIH